MTVQVTLQPPTTRWRNNDVLGPDGKGVLVGSPDAAISTLAPVSHKFTYPKKEDEDRRDALIAAKQRAERGEPEPEVVNGVKVNEVVRPIPDTEGLEEIKATIRELSQAHKTGNAMATGALEKLRDAEYQRPNGGRPNIKRALSAAGFGKPK